MEEDSFGGLGFASVAADPGTPGVDGASRGSAGHCLTDKCIRGSAGLVWHTLRHEYVSRTLENTGDPVVAQAMARHKDVRTTQGYLRARPTRLLEAALKLERAPKKRYAEAMQEANVLHFPNKQVV